ncbi:MAG: hypothetical protein HQ580_00670 [Planctomycetes bacterium]|nr:hypothetical protein [Planctomycetota bacterium]
MKIRYVAQEPRLAEVIQFVSQSELDPSITGNATPRAHSGGAFRTYDLSDLCVGVCVSQWITLLSSGASCVFGSNPCTSFLISDFV